MSRVVAQDLNRSGGVLNVIQMFYFLRAPFRPHESGLSASARRAAQLPACLRVHKYHEASRIKFVGSMGSRRHKFTLSLLYTNPKLPKPSFKPFLKPL